MDSTLQPGFEPQEEPLRRAWLGVEPIRFVAAAYALWFVALNVTFHLQPLNKVLLEAVLLTGAIPAMLHGMFLRIDTRNNAPGWWFLWVFLVTFLLSYMLNKFGWEDLINLFNVLFVFLIGILVSSTVDRRLISKIAASFAVLFSPYLLYVNLTGEYVWGRLVAGSQPNVWGLLSVNIAVGAFALKSRLLQVACLSVALMTLYNAEARGSMMATIPILCVFLYHWYAHQRKVDVASKWIVTYVLIVIAFSIVAFYSDVIINDILRLNDPYRGLQSGATGRNEAWSEALRLWFNSPMFGVGFRKHEEYMVFSVLSAHNAYLAMLADTGFVGFLAYMAFLIGSLVAAVRGVTDDRLRMFLVAVIASYAVAGLFERRAINTGNSFSILFIFACLLALRLAWEKHRSRAESKVASVAAPPLLP